MKTEEDNIILKKSYSFALRCVKAYKHLTQIDNPNREYVLSKQFLRSGTSIGANVREAEQGQSKADFAAKMNIALKEANETLYWIELLSDAEYFTEAMSKSIKDDCIELIKILTSIVKKSFATTK